MATAVGKNWTLSNRGDGRLDMGPAPAELNPPGFVPGEQGNAEYMVFQPWRTSSDIVNGWDFAISPNATIEPRSGNWMYQAWNGPSEYVGNRLYQYGGTWKECEPTEGDYSGIDTMFANFDSIMASGNVDGIFLQLRGVVTNYTDPNNKDTCPLWLAAEGNTAPPEAIPGGHFVTHLDMENTRNQNLYEAFIQQVATRLNERTDVKAILMHGISNTRGEEWGGPSASKPAIRTWWVNKYLPAWYNNTDADKKWRLAWLRADFGQEQDFTFWDTAKANGYGFRPGGNIETYLYNQYGRGRGTGIHAQFNEISGQFHDDDGYYITDENHPMISNKLHWQEQNEVHTGSFPGNSNSTRSHHHRMALFRVLQMRFAFNWEVNGAPLNKPMVAWSGTQLGHRYDTAVSAWCLLMQTWSRTPTTTNSSWQDRPVNNFERWLYQRESNGATSLALRQVWNQAYQGSISSYKGTDGVGGEYTDMARYAPSIGLALDPLFMSGNSNNVCIKVTYMDTAPGTWNLRYTDSNDNQRTVTVTLGNDNMLRTASIFVSNLKAAATGYNPDFYLESTSIVPFLFVQVYKV